MLLFYENELVERGEEFEGTNCPACNHNKWNAVTVIRYVSFTILPLFPFKKIDSKRCKNCSRTLASEANQTQYSHPTISKASLLCSTVSGLPILVGLFLLISSYLNFLAQEQEKVRHTPKAGDILFINYFKMSGKDNEILYPIRIGKVAGYNKQGDKIALKISSFKYGFHDSAQMDFRGRSYLFNSYFKDKTIEVALSELQDRTLFYHVERPFHNVDIEFFQKETSFEKTYSEYPSL